MSSTVVYTPNERHQCRIYDSCSLVGTIRKCDTCGKTWVYKIKCYYGMIFKTWEPESKFARWRRERKERKCPATCLD